MNQSTQNVIATCKQWLEILESNPDLAGEESWYTSSPPGAVATRYYQRGWIAFAHDFGGNHLGIDINPGPAGTAGQVINFGSDEDDKVAIASSLSALLSWLADELERGNWQVIEHPENPDLRYEFQINEPACGHILDAVKQMDLPT